MAVHVEIYRLTVALQIALGTKLAADANFNVII